MKSRYAVRHVTLMTSAAPNQGVSSALRKHSCLPVSMLSLVLNPSVTLIAYTGIHQRRSECCKLPVAEL